MLLKSNKRMIHCSGHTTICVAKGRLGAIRLNDQGIQKLADFGSVDEACRLKIHSDLFQV